ncbi:DUF6392 family protein [Pragia fontium]|uniref:Pyocin immunity protein n=1 Tax=Pragia fontium DSM 5563 = ATCC 49100 TaxID=1122977 RepID=A0AAJ4W893_9GAMM|nr:DUF6392 family protein [Pragia fontium]AKJ41154.1 pyocin immunity protein [Pragia fontium]SFC12123.1 hypothetical protein SAMN02745723_101445 [Pragia fontium DSM 5563 = ATCC 49100]
MTVNVEALIQSLGKTYQEIMDNELIPYITKPTGSSGDPFLNLDMAKEGIFLTFNRNDRVLVDITLTILKEKNEKYCFPNELPPPLIPEMNRTWVHNLLGKPEKVEPPKVFLKDHYGWVELYRYENPTIPTSMQISYDLQERAKYISFLPTSKVRW